MSSLLWLLMGWQSASDLRLARENPRTAEATQLFVRACLEGELKMNRDQMKVLDLKNVPYWIRQTVRGSKSARFYSISAPVKSILAIAEYDPPSDDGAVQDCLINTSSLDAETAAHLVRKSLKGADVKYHNGNRLFQMFLPQDRMNIYISHGYLAASTLSEAAAKKLGEKIIKEEAVSSR